MIEEIKFFKLIYLRFDKNKKTGKKIVPVFYI